MEVVVLAGSEAPELSHPTAHRLQGLIEGDPVVRLDGEPHQAVPHAHVLERCGKRNVHVVSLQAREQVLWRPVDADRLERRLPCPGTADVESLAQGIQAFVQVGGRGGVDDGHRPTPLLLRAREEPPVGEVAAVHVHVIGVHPVQGDPDVSVPVAGVVTHAGKIHPRRRVPDLGQASEVARPPRVERWVLHELVLFFLESRLNASTPTDRRVEYIEGGRPRRGDDVTEAVVESGDHRRHHEHDHHADRHSEDRQSAADLIRAERVERDRQAFLQRRVQAHASTHSSTHGAAPRSGPAARPGRPDRSRSRLRPGGRAAATRLWPTSERTRGVESARPPLFP